MRGAANLTRNGPAVAPGTFHRWSYSGTRATHCDRADLRRDCLGIALAQYRKQV